MSIAASTQNSALIARQHSNFATLDGMRGLAAVCVFLSHAERFSGAPVYALFAVDLFFIMSGFVIAYAYEGRLQSQLSVGRFLAVRWIRLYPLFFLSIVVGFVVSIVTARLTLSAAIESLGWSLLGLPTPGHGEDLLYPLNPAAWSLFFEVLVNAVYAVTWRHWTRRNLLIWVPVSCAALMLERMHYHQFDLGWSWDNALGGLARVAFGFPLGVLVYRFWAQGALRQALVPHWLTWAACALLLVWEPSYRVLEAPLVLAVAPVLVVLGVSAEPARGREVWTMVGTISYAIYTLHGSVLAIAQSILSPGLVSGAVTFIAVLVVSFVADAYYDAPVRAYLAGVLLGTRRSSRGT